MEECYFKNVPKHEVLEGTHRIHLKGEPASTLSLVGFF